MKMKVGNAEVEITAENEFDEIAAKVSIQNALSSDSFEFGTFAFVIEDSQGNRAFTALDVSGTLADVTEQREDVRGQLLFDPWKVTDVLALSHNKSESILFSDGTIIGQGVLRKVGLIELYVIVFEGPIVEEVKNEEANE